jgi:aldehyde:ferredoxin oxidoreductase
MDDTTACQGRQAPARARGPDAPSARAARAAPCALPLPIGFPEAETTTGARARLECAVDRLLARMADRPRYPTQGATLFVDLAGRRVRRGFTPREVVEALLEGRGANMFYLFNLLDESLHPLSPQVPLIFGSGILTGLVPSAARGNVTSWSPESGVLMDCNAGDYFPSFMKLNGIDRIIVYNQAPSLTMLVVRGPDLSFADAEPYRGLDNIDLRERVARDFGGQWAKDLAMASITGAGERLVLAAGIMAGPKSIWARGGPGAKMGALNLKAILIHGTLSDPETAAPFKPTNAAIARKLLGTSVVKHALKVRGTPFLYKPSRVLGAMGARNNQETTWTDQLDAERIDPYRPGMEGCYRCPVNCRPLNDMTANPEVVHDRYSKGEGPEYVTLGKFGPNIGITRVEDVLRLNNVANDLGLDTASAGSTIAWAMELYQRGLITDRDTGGLALPWGDAKAIERLLFMMARREGFGTVLADTTRAVERGHYPAEALDFRMAVKGLFQSDPHDSRILKAFALGLAVATRGMDHLRNRVTLEINARINDDPGFKERLYGGPVSAEPNVYREKERAVRACENMYAVGDSVGMCRFTTKLFNSPSLPDYDDFSQQIANITGLALSPEALDTAGLAITGVERLINHRLGVRRADDTLPRRWFEEPVAVGPYAGEKIDRAEFDRMLSRFYEVTGLDEEGAPAGTLRDRLAALLTGFAVRVRLPESLAGIGGSSGDAIMLTRQVATLGELVDAVDAIVPGFRDGVSDSMYNFAVNGTMILHGVDRTPIRSGDEVDVIPAIAGG